MYRIYRAHLRMDYGAVFVATALSAAIGCLIMGLIARYPLALAPGLGLNAFFAYTVVLGTGTPWQHALGAVFISSMFFLILTLTGLREKLINAIPIELKHAVGAGIGLFITFVGLQSSGIIVNNDATLVGHWRYYSTKYTTFYIWNHCNGNTNDERC